MNRMDIWGRCNDVGQLTTFFKIQSKIRLICPYCARNRFFSRYALYHTQPSLQTSLTNTPQLNERFYKITYEFYKHWQFEKDTMFSIMLNKRYICSPFSTWQMQKGRPFNSDIITPNFWKFLFCQSFNITISQAKFSES